MAGADSAWGRHREVTPRKCPKVAGVGQEAALQAGGRQDRAGTSPWGP